jgi:hypothetical protein
MTKKCIRFSAFEKAEITHKLYVLLDTDEWLDAEGALKKLIQKVLDNKRLLSWEKNLLIIEAADLLVTAEINYQNGYPEYLKDVRKLHVLNRKLQLQ